MRDEAANVSAREVAYFSGLSDKWWDKKGELRALHEINPLRLRYVERRMCLAGSKVLDVGCGGGILSEAVAEQGARVVGIDTSQTQIEAAKAHAAAAELDVDYRVGAIEELTASREGSFDGIFCMELLEHVPDPGAILRSAIGLLRPGGHMFCATLNRNPLSYALAILLAERVLGLLTPGTHSLEQLITPKEMRCFAREAGLEVRDISGFVYIPFLRRAFFAPEPWVNYLVHLRRPQSGEL
jgi:2-polyprenyl-6-hydroxyphenyl methylase/3-demethylubiquinone-9 3-methyltransferase